MDVPEAVLINTLYYTAVNSKKPSESKGNAVHPQARKIILFALAGCAGFIVDATTVVLLRHWTGLDLVSAKGVGFSLAVTVTWALNRRFAFAQRAESPLFQEWLRYVWANGLGGLVNNGVYLVAVFGFEDLAQHPALAVALGSLAGMFFNYATSNWWVFRHPHKH